MSQEVEQDGSGYGVSKTSSKRKNKNIIPSLYNSTCKIFEKYGWRKSYIKYAITPQVAIDMEDYNIVDMLTSQMEKAYLKHSKLSEDVLYSLGIKRVKARQYFSIIKDLLNTCYSNEHLFQIIAEYTTGRNDPIGIPGKSFLYNEKVINVWYTHMDIPYANIGNVKLINNILKQMPNKQDSNSHTLFFHATSWKSLKSILNKGVRHTYGRECLDFGKWRSFYMTPDINTAINWCNKREENWFKECCILVYSIPNINTNKNKIFESNNKEWQDNVKESRQCFDSDEIQYLDTFDIVYGPMCANVYQVKYDDVDPIPHSKIRFQLASKTESSDKFITKCFSGVLLLKSH